MRPPATIALALAITAAASGGGAAPAPASAAAHAARQRLVLDARFTSVSAAGPDAEHVGHQQIVKGVLLDAAGRRAGRFGFTCTWTAVTPSVREHCIAFARTADGILHIAGPGTPTSTYHPWKVTGGTGAFRGARGLAAVRDLNDRESLVAATVTTRRGVALRSGLAPVEPRNAAFTTKAQRACRRASTQLAELPAFPFANFDPLHPDPAVLPQVGAFFTGPGDPRPALKSLDRRLRALGRPPALRATWRKLLRARAAELATIQAQDEAALASDVKTFIRTVHASSRDFAAEALAATVFAAPACVM